MSYHLDKFRVAIYLKDISQETSTRVYCLFLHKALTENYGLHSKNHLTLPQDMVLLKTTLSALSYHLFVSSSQRDISKYKFFLNLFCSLPLEMHYFFTSLMPLTYLALDCTCSAQHYSSKLSTWLQNSICSSVCFH